MFCSSCGKQTADGSAFCGSCGRPVVGYSVGASTAGAAPVASAGVAAPQAGTRAYAGFWLRFVAYIIDELLILIVFGILGLLVAGVIGFGSLREQFEEMGRAGDRGNPAFPVFLVLMICTFFVCAIIGGWLYFAGMESSVHQGTLGKMALGLVVTDMNGRPVSFGRASGRFFAKIITSLVPLYIGFIMAGFTEKKQALHDMIASCLVLRKV